MTVRRRPVKERLGPRPDEFHKVVIAGWKYANIINAGNPGKKERTERAWAKKRKEEEEKLKRQEMKKREEEKERRKQEARQRKKELDAHRQYVVVGTHALPVCCFKL